MEERHKQERKELQAKVQQIKHAVPKGDKKRQKEAKAEIAQLELELKQKHDREIKEGSVQSTVTECVDSLEAVTIGTDTTGIENQSKKSKAAKRREKKEREEREREKRIVESMADTANSARNIEHQRILVKLKESNLVLYDIPSDGDCLYKAIAHQLSIRTSQPPLSVQEMRSRTANEMRKAMDDYLPYLTSSDGDLLDENGFVDYLSKVEFTHEWGGQVEIKALCASLGHPIQIIQADMPDIHIGENMGSREPLTIVYHRKLYELGEHYNSVVSTESH